MADFVISDVIKEAQENGYNIPEEYNPTTYPFRPVKCTETALKKIEPVEGYVYFATDSKKIYCAHNGKFLGMGGNSGVYYGNKAIQDDEIAYVVFDLENEDIDGDTLPNIDDLIINVGGTQHDGFYRVRQILSETQVQADRVPISTGGSGGGGTGASGFARIDRVTPTPAETIINTEFNIEYILVAQDASGDDVISQGTATWRVNNQKVAEQKVYVGKNSFRIDQYLDAARGNNTVSLTISIDTGGSANTVVSKIWEINAINLAIAWNWDYSETNLISTDKFTLSWTPYGGVPCVTHIIFDNNIEPGVGYFEENIRANQTGSLVSRTFDSLSYGTHTIEMYLTAEINGTQYRTQSVFHKLTFIVGGETPIITVPFFQTTATQYDTIQIPFQVYDPLNALADVTLSVNGIEVSVDKYDRNLHNWTYAIGVSGTLIFTLSCRGVSYSTTLIVAPLELDIHEATGRQFSLKASQFSGASELRSWNENGVNLSFSDNFDWANSLGTEKDEKGNIRQFIRVKHDTTMTINYNLFGNIGKQQGKNFKFIFKATNCYDYDAKVLDCYEESSKIGIKLTAQKGIFSSTNTEIDTDYCEDSYIELEADIWQASSVQNAEQYMMFWIDGVPSAVAVYNNDTVFQQSRPLSITIGSSDCDVYVYLVKVYERNLTQDEHINNFIIDAPNTEELLSRYRRNNILDNNGNISWTKLAEAAPDCNVYLYNIPKMTENKKDPVSNCHFEYYKGSDSPTLTADNVTIKVQGTSSVAYGIAAFNLDSDFSSNGFTQHIDNQEQHIDKYAMSDNSIPIDYFCTKVNVASCENSNNAMNAEWYNRFQPYRDGNRRKKVGARDCMEFKPGVVFILDKNNDVTNEDYVKRNVFFDTAGYVSNPYYKQYAICNMGNSKKNIEVFHDETNPKVCCIEVTDNQAPEQWMTDATNVDIASFNRDSVWFEFRYPDGNDAASIEMKQAWCDFVKWMADSNPAAHTDEPLEKSVTFQPYTFKGYRPPDFNTDSGYEVLKGVTISTYAGTYDTDSYEYRMAKMLNECEDHLVMDSIVFHYLFIERHTMVDNVAKNTFWSTEDLQHWDLTKNYDNDTADGNNNSGFLKFSYGLECFDQADGSWVFNAHQSVWLNFVDGLHQAKKAMYTTLASRGAWNAESYLKETKQFQDCIPERCWVEDYFRKYLRPRRIGKDEGSTYIQRLEGGKKTHQRQQYETYQRYYLDSKYRADSSLNNSIDIRANAQDIKKGTKAPLTSYIDCYAWTLIGGQETPELIRLKRGQIYDIPIDQVPDMNDSTVYIYNSHIIQTIENLQAFFAQTLDTNSARKLRVLEAGSDNNDYINTSMESIGLPNNSLLEKLLLQNIPGASGGLGSLDLTRYDSLKEFRSNGSSFTSLAFADGSALEIAYINPVSSLRMDNLKNIKEIHFDEGINDSLTTLHVANCPLVDTYSLVMNCSGLIRYFLTDVNWIITENSLSDNNLVQIDVLEKFSIGDDDRILKPEGTNTTAAALTGKIFIDIDCNVNKFAIYQKYIKYFPNLTIEYSDKVSSLPTAEIIFMRDDTSDDVLYKVMTDGYTTIETLISDSGPTGIAMGKPSKASTERYDYTWNGDISGDIEAWYDKATNQKYSHDQLKELTPNIDTIYVPIFTEKEHIYTITLYNESEIVGTYERKYDDEDLIFPVYLYKENLNFEKRYNLKGWISQEDYFTNQANATYLKKVSSPFNRNANYYAIFEEEDITKPSSMDLFVFNRIDGNTNWRISFNPDYLDIYQGILTIPAKHPDGTYIVSIGDFRNMSKVTHILFEEGSTYTEIPDNFGFGFNNIEVGLAAAIKTIELPSSLQNIGKAAFQNMVTLENVNIPDNVKRIGTMAFAGTDQYFMKVKINKLPSQLEVIEDSAFRCGGGGITFTEIPPNVEIIPTNAFYCCYNVHVTEFGSDNGENSKLREIGQWGFGNRSGYPSNDGQSKDTIYINKSITTLGNNCFAYYNFETLDKIYFARSEEYYKQNSKVGDETTLLNFIGITWPVTESYEEQI